MKRNKRIIRTISLLISLILLINILAMPVGLVADAADELVSLGASAPPTSVPDKVDVVLKNPHDVEVSVQAYPIRSRR